VARQIGPEQGGLSGGDARCYLAPALRPAIAQNFSERYPTLANSKTKIKRKCTSDNDAEFEAEDYKIRNCLIALF